MARRVNCGPRVVTAGIGGISVPTDGSLGDHGAEVHVRQEQLEEMLVQLLARSVRMYRTKGLCRARNPYSRERVNVGSFDHVVSR
jgi:hypothetical protein